MWPEMGIIIDVYKKYAINAINICIYIYIYIYVYVCILQLYIIVINIL